MKIDILSVSKATSFGLKIDEYITLLVLQDGCSYIFTSLYFLEQGIIPQLVEKGLCNIDGILTEKANKLIKGIENLDGVSNKKDNKWEELHKKLQDELFRLTGKKQAKANGNYTFLCNQIDLHNKLSKCISKYQLKSWEKVEKLLILHINKAYKQKFDKILLLQYYIEKNGMSTLASDYEDYNEIEQKKEESQEFDGVNI